MIKLHTDIINSINIWVIVSNDIQRYMIKKKYLEKKIYFFNSYVEITQTSF